MTSSKAGYPKAAIVRIPSSVEAGYEDIKVEELVRRFATQRQTIAKFQAEIEPLRAIASAADCVLMRLNDEEHAGICEEHRKALHRALEAWRSKASDGNV